MNIIWGVTLTMISSLGWLGQLVSAINPPLGEKLGLTEVESEVDPAFYADMRGEVWWDTVILWTLPVAGVLLILNHPAWAYFGLIGGGMYLYFAGRGIVTRREMQRRGIRIGSPESLKIAYSFLMIWGLTAAITIVMAVGALALN